MNHRRPWPCHGSPEAPGKRRFKDRTAAEFGLSLIWTKGWDRPGPMPTRSYRCVCGNWHITPQPLTSPEPGEVVSENQPHGTNGTAA